MDPRYSAPLGFKLVRLPRWASVLAIIAAIALGVLLIVVAAGLALILIPIIVISGLILRWRLRRAMATAPRSSDVIEVEYRVVDRER